MTSLPLALITGASRGLGASVAEELAAHGYHVLAVARTTSGLEALDTKIKARGGQATLAPMDITDANAMAYLCRSIYDRWGGLSLWIHTALHTAPLTPAQHVDEKDMTKSITTNIQALSRLIVYVDPLLRGQSPVGRAIFFDDDPAAKFTSYYHASKAAQRALIISWQAESTTPNAPIIKILKPNPMATAHRARFYPGEDTSRLETPQTMARMLLPNILDQAPQA